ncbi:MAG: hypothetical protein ABI634_07275 [Acidobacteriota bacterium]
MNRQTRSRSAVAVGCRFGLLLGAMHVINHSLEVFANLQPPLPAVRGVAMWVIIFAVCGAASSVGVGRTRSVRLGTVASVLAAVCGAVLLVVYAIAVGVARGEPLPFQTIVSTGGIHIGGSVLVGLAIGLVSGSIAAALVRTSRATAIGAVVSQVLLLALGLAAIEHATGLERSARPPFIMFGLPAVAVALAVLAPAVWVLTVPGRTAEGRA